MYLKSIEVQGFKSFANKIVFEFHNGITGIVGPNGSGKSNVADAVRWVLGEQRIKQLRGASMQDVIFSGTELRKPQGFAYVAITLDNSDHQLAIDYDEVTVSRRIYRSGESEYRINGSACRLKDVNELFYDTGIGKEGYSIIGQGQIDKILSGKPEERRELFDEAAGIVKFKRRKAIAQKKLEDEKQNLVRVTDILSELEKQVGPLAKQSETAREYLKLKEELKRYEVNLFLTETKELKVQLREVESKEQIVTGDLEETQKTSEQIRVTYEELDQQLEQKNQELEKLPSEPDMPENEEYQAVVAEIQKKQEQLDGLTNNSEEKAAVQAERMSAEKELTGIETKIEMAKQAVQKQTETLEQLNANRKKLSQEDSDIQQKLDMLKEFSIKKNQKLAEAINPHFKHFQFQFLDYTQDGEPVEVCKMICDGIGYFDGLNHSDQILCNIDLVTGLQELNGLNLPIWVDDVESVNADRIPDTGRQMILLKVSDNELKVERI